MSSSLQEDFALLLVLLCVCGEAATWGPGQNTPVVLIEPHYVQLLQLSNYRLLSLSALVTKLMPD